MRTRTAVPTRSELLVYMRQVILGLEQEQKMLGLEEDETCLAETVVRDLEEQQARLAKQVALLENGQEILLDMAERMDAATNKRMDAKIKKTVKKVLLNTMSGLRVDESE